MARAYTREHEKAKLERFAQLLDMGVLRKPILLAPDDFAEDLCDVCHRMWEEHRMDDACAWDWFD